MKGDALHEFDLALCRYALDNIRGHLTKSDFSVYARTQIAQPIWVHLLAPGDSSSLLVSEEDLHDLADAFANAPFQLDRSWIPYEPLHNGSINCVREIREELAGEHGFGKTAPRVYLLACLYQRAALGIELRSHAIEGAP